MSGLTQLRHLLNSALDVLKSEFISASLPPLNFEPVPHPLDSADGPLPSTKLFEARRVALATIDMIKNLLKPVSQSMLRQEGAFNVSGSP